jgi:hypothetical protein
VCKLGLLCEIMLFNRLLYDCYTVKIFITTSSSCMTFKSYHTINYMVRILKFTDNLHM